MDEKHGPGTDKRVSGSLKEAIGKITGDADVKTEGAAEQQSGEAQDAEERAKAGQD